jgi:hypothetical protein
MKTPIEEREELIVWTHDSPCASVYSFLPAIWKACQKGGGQKLREGVRSNGHCEWQEWLVPVARLGLVLSHLSEESKKIAAKIQGNSSGLEKET